MPELDEVALKKARLLRVKVRQKRYDNERDKELADEIDWILENVEDFHVGEPDCRRGLFVTGPAGTGKTFALKHALSSHPRLQPYRNVSNKLVRPCISVKLGKEAKPLNLIKQVLTKLDIPSEGHEPELGPLLRDQLKLQGVILLHLDEAQHTVRSNTSKAFEAVQDLVKGMIDREDWPLHVILSGMPRIENMREDDQIERRSRVTSFRPLKGDADLEEISGLVTKVANDCELRLAENVTSDEFIGRLCKAAHGAFGTIICDVRNACFRAISRGMTEVTINHFGIEYERNTGALRSENIFLAKDWQLLKVKDALKSMQEEV